MKRQSFQKKRRPTGGGLFVFHSKTRPRRRRKQRVAAGASPDLGSEVPNLGVARALFVILVLHVAAIAAIFIHNRVTDSDSAATIEETEPTTATVATPGREKLPVVQKGEDIYFVATGDTYQRIAELKGVDVRALRDLNDNVKLKAGRILRIPAGGFAEAAEPEIEVAEAVAPEPASERELAPEPPTPVRVAPAAPASTTQVIADSDSTPPIVVRRAVPAEPIRVVADQESTSERGESRVATRVTPNVPAPAAAAEATRPAAEETYTIKKGDTAWGISQRHKVPVDLILKANGITDARKLRPGMKLTIPAQ